MDSRELVERGAHCSLVKLAAHCERLAGGRDMPYRRDFRASQVPWVFESLFLLDVLHDENDYYFRLTGGLMEKAYGATLTGQRLSAIAGAGLQESLRASYDTVVATRAPLYVRGKYRWPNREMEVERLLIPLADADGRLSTILGAVHAPVSADLLVLLAGVGPATFVPAERPEFGNSSPSEPPAPALTP
ncbi:MAG: PAS domain-containing protein [Alphaproteobacteria bacterium]|nr:PAS domain-containing protein [Alphaproteobacteria bacterium]MDE2112615.1 PAS domain-containing protein [Alphaproteobacteria bacterium]MDE2494452.1 PAS domain-containing protein [Alphaproteobacteria bacterium]